MHHRNTVAWICFAVRTSINDLMLFLFVFCLGINTLKHEVNKKKAKMLLLRLAENLHPHCQTYLVKGASLYISLRQISVCAALIQVSAAKLLTFYLAVTSSMRKTLTLLWFELCSVRPHAVLFLILNVQIGVSRVWGRPDGPHPCGLSLAVSTVTSSREFQHFLRFDLWPKVLITLWWQNNPEYEMSNFLLFKSFVFSALG